MNFTKQKSRGVFFIIILFLILLVFQVILYGNFFKELKSDTQVINDLSRIRGSIQRFTKLVLSGEDAKSLNQEIYIDGLMKKNRDLVQEEELGGIMQHYDMKNLISEWEKLKTHASDYRMAPDQHTKEHLIEVSELCWEIADASVVRQQYIVNKTTAYYKYFTITFGINLFAIMLILLLYKKFVYNSLASSAINDSLTGIFNKGYFDKYLEYEIARAVRTKATFSLIMLDIDRFKLVNDTYGHQRGDYALNTLAKIVGKCKRNADVLARFGGEEFILLLPDTGVSDAALLATRIRKSVEEYAFEEIGRMTISLGITEFTQADNQESIVKRVDAALYLAKANGRNRCEVIGGEES